MISKELLALAVLVGGLALGLGFLHWLNWRSMRHVTKGYKLTPVGWGVMATLCLAGVALIIFSWSRPNSGLARWMDRFGTFVGLIELVVGVGVVLLLQSAGVEIYQERDNSDR